MKGIRQVVAVKYGLSPRGMSLVVENDSPLSLSPKGGIDKGILMGERAFRSDCHRGEEEREEATDEQCKGDCRSDWRRSRS